MSRAATFPAVRAIILAELHNARLWLTEPEVQPDSSLADLGVDDLCRIAISMRLEEEFGVAISDEEERRWTHVSDVVRAVEGEVPAQREERVL